MADQREILAEGKYLKLVKEGTWEYAERTRGIRAVAIVALTRKGEMIFTEQYRVPCKCRVIDLPAGLVGDEPGCEHEPELEAARRELLEETGFIAETFEKLVCGPTTAGLASERVTFYMAENCDRVASGGGVAGEEIQIHLVPASEALGWMREVEKEERQIDVKTWFAAAWMAHRNPH